MPKKELSDRDRKMLELYHSGDSCGMIAAKFAVSIGVANSVKQRNYPGWIQENGFSPRPIAPGPKKGMVKRVKNENTGEYHKEGSETHVKKKSRWGANGVTIAENGIPTSDAVARANAKYGLKVFKPEIQEGMTSKEILEQYDFFKTENSRNQEARVRREETLVVDGSENGLED